MTIKKQESKLQQERALATRELIVQGAAEVFAEFGYAASSLGDIASHTGVTQGAIYFHFASKNALGEEIIKRQHELSMGVGKKTLAEERRAIEKILLVTQRVAQQLVTQPVVRAGLRLSTESSMFFPGYAKIPYIDWIKTCEEIFHAAMAEGDVDETQDARLLGKFTVNMYVGTQVVSSILTGWNDLFQELQTMWEMMLPSILPAERQKVMMPLLLDLIEHKKVS